MKVYLNNVDQSEFTEIFLSILDKDAAKINKFIPAKNFNFVFKKLKNAIMKRWKLWINICEKKQTQQKVSTIKQRNLCVSILRKKERLFQTLKRQNCYW